MGPISIACFLRVQVFKSYPYGFFVNIFKWDWFGWSFLKWYSLPLILLQNIVLVYKTRNFQFFQKNKNLDYKPNTAIKTMVFLPKHILHKKDFNLSSFHFQRWHCRLHVMDYCGLLWVTMGYCGLFYVLDVVMSFCFVLFFFFSIQIYNHCFFKLYENYKNIILVLHVKTSSIKVNFNCIMIWKVYNVNIWHNVELHGKYFQDIHLIQQWSN